MVTSMLKALTIVEIHQLKIFYTHYVGFMFIIINNIMLGLLCLCWV